MKRIASVAVAALALAAAGGALAGNPNPTESQDPFWDLKDQAAAWREVRTQREKAAERKEQPKPEKAVQSGAKQG